MDHFENPNNTFALRIKDLNGETKDYPIDRESYLQHYDHFGRLYGRTVVFKTLSGNRVRGILDNVVCTVNPEKQ